MKDRGRMVLLMEEALIDVVPFLASEEERECAGRSRRYYLPLPYDDDDDVESQRSHPLSPETKGQRGCYLSTVPFSSALLLSSPPNLSYTNGPVVYLSAVTISSPFRYLIRLSLSLIISENRVRKSS